MIARYTFFLVIQKACKASAIALQGQGLLLVGLLFVAQKGQGPGGGGGGGPGGARAGRRRREGVRDRAQPPAFGHTPLALSLLGPIAARTAGAVRLPKRGRGGKQI